MASSSLYTGYTRSSTDKNTYTRPLGGAELPGALAISAPGDNPREPIRIHIFTHLTSSAPPARVIPALRRAWLALRLLHEPDIATTFSPTAHTKNYSIPTASDTESWLARTFLVASSRNETVEAIVRAEQCRSELLPVLHVIPDADSSSDPLTSFSGTLLFLASHWRTEASGVYTLFNTLFKLAADLLTHTSVVAGPISTTTERALAAHIPGDETALLTPAAEDMVQPDPTTLPAAAARVAAGFRALESRLPCIEVPTKPLTDSDPRPGPVGVVRRIYSAAATAALVARCKAAGVTVTAMVHAAYIGSLYPLHAANEGRWYASGMPAQIRTRLPVNHDGQQQRQRWRSQGCWNAAHWLILTAPPGVGLLERARALKEGYDVRHREGWMSEEYREWNRQLQAFNATAGRAATAVPWFTSLGVLERGLLQAEFRGDDDDDGVPVLKVGDVHGWADPMGLGCVFTMWTWRGSLNVQISWNTTFHDRETSVKILDGMDEAIGRELGVTMDEHETKNFEY